MIKYAPIVLGCKQSPWFFVFTQKQTLVWISGSALSHLHNNKWVQYVHVLESIPFWFVALAIYYWLKVHLWWGISVELTAQLKCFVCRGTYIEYIVLNLFFPFKASSKISIHSILWINLCTICSLHLHNASYFVHFLFVSTSYLHILPIYFYFLFMYDYFLFISYNTHPTQLVLRTDHTDQLSKAADQCCGWDKQRCCDNHHWLCSWSLMYSGLWSLGPTPKGDFHAISSFFCILPPSSSSSPLWSVVMTMCIMWKPLQSHLRFSLFVKNSP